MSQVAIHIDFASRRFTGFKRIEMLAVLATCLWTAVIIDLCIEARAQHNTAVAALKQSEGAPVVKTAPSPHASEELKEADSVLDRLSIRWDDLFGTLEQASSGELDLLSIAPDPAAGNVRISGQAKDFGDILGFVSRLGQQPGLQQVQLASFQAVQRGSGPVIEFMVTAEWK
jgi:hypothetical protein